MKYLLLGGSQVSRASDVFASSWICPVYISTYRFGLRLVRKR